MISVKVKRGKTYGKVVRNLRTLNGSKVDVGHFGDSGVHYSGLTYVELLRMWARGIESKGVGGRIIQDVRKQFIFKFLMSGEAKRHPQIMAAVARWFNGADQANLVDYLLNALGHALVDEYRDMFNVKQGPFMDGTDTPLFETGDLQEATKYKIKKR